MSKAKEQEVRLMGLGFAALVLLTVLALIVLGTKLRDDFRSPASSPVMSRSDAGAGSSLGGS